MKDLIVCGAVRGSTFLLTAVLLFVTGTPPTTSASTAAFGFVGLLVRPWLVCGILSPVFFSSFALYPSFFFIPSSLVSERSEDFYFFLKH
jgi:hypothetical protein